MTANVARRIITAGLAVAVLLAIGPAASARLVPTHGAVVHLDANPPGVSYAIPVPGRVIIDPFGDGLNAPSEPWHWETEFENPPGNPGPLVLPIIWRAPGFVRTAVLTIPVGITVIVDNHPNDRPETGRWVHTAIFPGPQPMAWLFDVSVTEDPEHVVEPPPELRPAPYDSVVALPHHVEIKIAKPTPSMTLYGMIVFCALLASVGAWLLWRRRNYSVA